MQERFIPMYLTAAFDSVTGDNFTKYLCLLASWKVEILRTQGSNSLTLSGIWKGCRTASIHYGTDAETFISE